jgi:hypothetical protein
VRLGALEFALCHLLLSEKRTMPVCCLRFPSLT